jgi:hypothetical protein
MEIWCLPYKDDFIVWQNNRPLVRKDGSKKQIQWKLIKPKRVDDAKLIWETGEAIKQIIKDMENKGPASQIEYARTRKNH